jgi:beta-phosphoglucomutase-like phosphatase (HAD superfamily)
VRADHNRVLSTRLEPRTKATGDFTAYPDALRFIIHVKDAGICTAAASSSKNAKLFLSKIRLDTFAEENGSPGVAATGSDAARLLRRRRLGEGLRARKAPPRHVPGSGGGAGAAPEDSIVMEDAAAGVQAAKAGHMAAIGIARVDEAELLAAAHADIVLTSLDHVDLAALRAGRLATKRA